MYIIITFITHLLTVVVSSHIHQCLIHCQAVFHHTFHRGKILSSQGPRQQMLQDCRQVFIDLLHYPDPDTSDHGRRDVLHQIRSSYDKKRNALGISRHLCALITEKNSNFCFRLFDFHSFFVPLRPRNFSDWNPCGFSLNFLG